MSNASPSPATPAVPGKPRLPRPVRIGLYALLGFVGVVIVAFLIVGFAVDLGGVVGSEIKKQLPQAKAKLGREVRIGTVRLKLLPEVKLDLVDVNIEANPEATGVAAQPLLHIGAVRARIGIWPLLISGGRDVIIRSAEVADLRLIVVRDAQGRVSYQDILDKLETQPESPPSTPEEIARLAGIVVRRAVLSDGGIAFYDLGSPSGASSPIRIDQINLEAKEARLFSPFTLSLDLAAMASSPNFHLGVTVGPMPADLVVTSPIALLRRLELEVQPLEIAPILRFLPPSQDVSLERAKVQAKLKLETPASGGSLTVSAQAAAKGLILEKPGAPLVGRRGQPVDVGIVTELSADPAAGNVKLDRFELSLNEMAITGKADVRSLWTSPLVHTLGIESRGLLLERLLAALPPAAIPPGSVVHGPVVVSGAASGSAEHRKIEARIDLTGATLALPVLKKPESTPFLFELRGEVQPTGLDIERFGLTLGPLALLLKGKLRSASDLELTADTGLVDLDELLRFLPTVEKAVPKKSRIDGDLRVTGGVKKKDDVLTAHAKISMRNARIEQGDLDLLGSAELAASVSANKTSASVSADLDLTPARLRVPGSVDKGTGIPMRMRLQAEQSEKRINVKLAELTLPGGTVRIAGKADLAGKNLDLKVPLVDLDLSHLSRVLPGLRKGSMGGLLDSKLRFSAAADGNPNKLSTVHARIDPFELSVGGGTIKGSADVVGLDEPRKISFNFNADKLDLDRILGDDKDKDDDHASSSRSSSPPPKFLKRLDMNGRLQIDSGRYKGAAVRDFLLELTMAGGRLVIKTLRAGAFGGSVMASGTTVDFGPSQPRFSLRTKLEKIDLASVMAMGKDSASDRKLSGRGSVDLSVDGSGLSWEDMAPQLTGALGLGIVDGKLESGGMSAPVVGPLVQQVGQSASQVAGRDLSLKELSAQFRIERGRLRTTNPIRFTSEEGAINLTGSIGLDKTLDLNGTLDLSPRAISAATQGRLVPDVPIPVSIHLGGTLAHPEPRPTDLLRTVAALTAAILRGRGGNLLGNTSAGGVPLGKVLGGQGGKPGLNLPILGNQPAPQPAGQPGAPPGAPPSALPITPTPAQQDAAQRGLRKLFGR